MTFMYKERIDNGTDPIYTDGQLYSISNIDAVSEEPLATLYGFSHLHFDWNYELIITQYNIAYLDPPTFLMYFERYTNFQMKVYSMENTYIIIYKTENDLISFLEPCSYQGSNSQIVQKAYLYGDLVSYNGEFLLSMTDKANFF